MSKKIYHFDLVNMERFVVPNKEQQILTEISFSLSKEMKTKDPSQTVTSQNVTGLINPVSHRYYYFSRYCQKETDYRTRLPS